MLLGGGGIDEVGHGLGLREVEPSISEGSKGVFARFGQACACFNECVEQGFLHVGGAVAGELYCVLASIATWCGKIEGDAIVEVFACRGEKRGVGGVARVESVCGEAAQGYW